MRQAGEVVRVDIFQNDQGRSKGCGVVEFTNKQDCFRALKMFGNSPYKVTNLKKSIKQQFINQL